MKNFSGDSISYFHPYLPNPLTQYDIREIRPRSIVFTRSVNFGMKPSDAKIKNKLCSFSMICTGVSSELFKARSSSRYESEEIFAYAGFAAKTSETRFPYYSDSNDKVCTNRLTEEELFKTQTITRSEAIEAPFFSMLPGAGSCYEGKVEVPIHRNKTAPEIYKMQLEKYKKLSGQIGWSEVLASYDDLDMKHPYLILEYMSTKDGQELIDEFNHAIRMNKPRIFSAIKREYGGKYIPEPEILVYNPFTGKMHQYKDVIAALSRPKPQLRAGELPDYYRFHNGLFTTEPDESTEKTHQYEDMANPLSRPTPKLFSGTQYSDGYYSGFFQMKPEASSHCTPHSPLEKEIIEEGTFNNSM